MKNVYAFIMLSLLWSGTLSYAKTVLVSTFNELVNATQYSVPGDTVLIADGVYNMGGGTGIVVSVNNITIKSQSGNPEAVVINGRGMATNDHNGFWVNAHHVTFSDITVQNVGWHCIQTNVNIDNIHVKNCVFRDAGEQFFKVPTNGTNDPSENGIIENCLFEYTAGIGPQYYIGGVDCHKSKNWIVRNNVFKFIRSPDQNIAEHAIHFWKECEDVLVERNLIIDCDRGIGFGLGTSYHRGGTIRNNMIYHSYIGSNDRGDVGIGLESATDIEVYNNTIIFQHSYPYAIEYRFSGTNNVMIANNLTNKSIVSRDGGQASLSHNLTNIVTDYFEDISTGNLHLVSADIPQVIDKGIAISGLTVDFDGDQRPQGAGIDIGADEFIRTTGVESDNDTGTLPNTVKLNQSYPNPFHLATNISYHLAEFSHVTLKIYDITGREVTTIVNAYQNPGNYLYQFNAGRLPAGVYTYKLRVRDKILTGKLNLIK